MRIVFHAGAHFTQSDRLLKSLLRNLDAFAKRGIAVPGPARYRPLFKTIFQEEDGAPPVPDCREIIFDATLDDDSVETLILSNDRFFGAVPETVVDGKIYPDAPRRLQMLSEIFPHDQVELFLAVRNPATFVPAIRTELVNRMTRPDLLKRADPRSLRWSDPILQLRAAAPGIPITIWCNEDTPLIWPQVVRAVADYERDEPIAGGLEGMTDIMTEDGLRRLRAYIATLNEPSAATVRRLSLAFLEKFTAEDGIEEEIDMPGWTEALVDEMSDIYDEDIESLQQVDGVNVIFP